MTGGLLGYPGLHPSRHAAVPQHQFQAWLCSVQPTAEVLKSLKKVNAKNYSVSLDSHQPASDMGKHTEDKRHRATPTDKVCTTTHIPLARNYLTQLLTGRLLPNT